MNTARVREDYYGYENRGLVETPAMNSPVIEGYFYKENLIKEMAIRKVNVTLCSILTGFILVAFVSYYFEMSHEITLNTLSRQVTVLNDENAELQNTLDKLKSFNNVDNKMAQQNILQKAANVIEVPAITSGVYEGNKKSIASTLDLAIGY